MKACRDCKWYHPAHIWCTHPKAEGDYINGTSRANPYAMRSFILGLFKCGPWGRWWEPKEK